MKNRAVLWLFVALSLGGASGLARATDETRVKVAFLYNFARYTQWPDEQRATLRVCAIGDDTLGKTLDELIGRPVRHMQITVRHAVPLQDIVLCDLVFIPSGYALSMERVREVVNGFPILTVAESPHTLPKGSVLALIPAENRFVFDVDLSLARQLGLQISAKLLQLARKVQ